MRAAKAPLLVIAAACAAAAWISCRAARPPAFVLVPRADQNVLLVTIDTLRADALSAYGGPARTPNLDRLAARGARFTFAHAHAVVTLPSHTSILTGRLPYEHGMRDNSGFRVKPGTATLATRLKALGFATGAFVGGFPLTKRFGLTPGFDVYDDQMPETGGEQAIAMSERRADVVVSRAIEWIGKQNAKFFAWVHVFDPHSPYKPPDEFAGQYASQPYYGEVAWTDHALEALFERLNTLPRPTLVIVTADHGESLGEHGEATHGMFAYEPTLHVPLIVSGAGGAGGPTEVGRHSPSEGERHSSSEGERHSPSDGQTSTGIVVDAPVRHIDIVPTILDAVGAPADASLAGSTLGDVIRTAPSRGVRLQPDPSDRPTYFEAMTYNLVRGWAPLRGVVAGREKYIDLPIPELYDLAADAKEATNAADRSAERVRTLNALLKGYSVAPPNRPGQESAAASAALRSLGYVTGSAPGRTVYTEADDPKRLAGIDRDLHTATDHYQNGRREDAIALWNGVIAKRPDTADAYITLAHAYWEAGDVRAAVATLEKALANHAPDRDVRIRLAIYLAESGADPRKAVAVCEGLPDTDVEALNAKGIAYGAAGRFADAVAAFQRVLTLDASNGLAMQNIASMLLRQDKLPDAESYARQALAADPALAEAQTTLGVVLARTGRKNEAIESWKRAVAADPAQFNALYNLWHELAAAGRREEAARYGRQFVDTAPPVFFKTDIEEVGRYLRR